MRNKSRQQVGMYQHKRPIEVCGISFRRGCEPVTRGDKALIIEINADKDSKVVLIRS